MNVREAYSRALEQGTLKFGRRSGWQLGRRFSDDVLAPSFQVQGRSDDLLCRVRQ